jgi:hypothetical protein
MGMLRMSPEEYAALVERKRAQMKAGDKPKARLKFGNEKTEVAGQEFDSKKEARRFLSLKDMEAAGEIERLQTQQVFNLIPRTQKPSGGHERPCTYIADFTYIKDGRMVVEDTKSEATRKDRAYIIKRKLMLSVHGIEIKEV